MNPDRWLALSPLIDQALELSPAERAAFQEALRRDEPELAADLERLLGREKLVREQGFLADGSTALGAEPTLAGQQLGAYTLEAPLGAGGMGSVWRARRSDGRFEAAVAVKLLNAALLGRGADERFRREGTILARLTHPHIARLLDAGVSPIGQPYLVLELVDGEPIDRYCDARRLGVRARLRLVLDVLAAVAHAHANLVVHRDLKPSNVLVTSNGEVRLLDFGIAKLLAGEDGTGPATALTQDADQVLTPAYAAPEQVSGGAITTATDVYALGALVYVLLGGRHPAGAGARSPVELLRTIVEVEPRRLSDSVIDLRSEDAATLLENAASRATTPERLRRQLAGDLDTIVARALKKRPEDRYPSVAAMAADVEHFLDHRPIVAREDSLAYRAAKFCRRRRVPVALAALAAVALAAGVAAIAVESRRANRAAHLAAAQRDFALRQLSRAEAINELNSFLLTEAAPGGRPFTVGDLLARAERIVARQEDDPRGQQVELMIAVGRELHQHDRIAAALELLTKARERALAGDDVTTQARAACALALTVARSGDLERADALLAEGLAKLPEEPLYALPRIECLRLGGDLAREGRKDPERGLERVLAAQRLLRSSGQGSSLLEARLASDLAEAYRLAGRDREANAAFAEATDRLERLGYGDSEVAGTLYNNWALALRSQGNPLAAERLFRRAIAITSAKEGLDSVSPFTLSNLGYVLSDLHRFAEARELADRAFELARRSADEVPLQQALFLRARVRLRTGEGSPSRRG